MKTQEEKRVHPSKMIGLIRRIHDGRYEPTNESSKARLHMILEAANVPKPFMESCDLAELILLRQLAKAGGFAVVTTTRMVKP